MLRWNNGLASGTYERCDIDACLRSEGHVGRHRYPIFPALGPGRCRGCGAEVHYGMSGAGWLPRWRGEDGRVHRCAA